jgi:hypothetical protein
MQGIGTARPVEQGGVLIHIGPHKTGTTAVQDALVRAAPALVEQGFMYFSSGNQNNANIAVKAFARSVDRDFKYHSRSSRNPSHWTVIHDELTARPGQTAIISAEDLADLSESHVKQFIEAMGTRPVRVVMTLRSLAEIIPSQWQQFVKRGVMPSLEEWARELFTPHSAERKVDLFWQRHRHDALLQRWVSAVGADRVTVVVVDARERLAIYPIFEQLIGLKSGTLQPGDYLNESMSIEQAELVRATYLRLDEAGIDYVFGEKGPIIRIHKHLLDAKSAAPTHKPLLPGQAHEATLRVAQEIRHVIEKSGVAVVGDLDQLERIPSGELPQMVNGEVLVPASLGGAASVSLLRSAGIEGLRDRKMYQTFLDEVPLKVLLAVTYERLLQRIGLCKKP